MVTINEVHDVLRYFLILLKETGILISLTKNRFFLKCFTIQLFVVEIFSTHLTIQCFQYLLHMGKHIDEARTAMFVEKIEVEKVYQKHFQKAQTLFGFSVQDIKIQDIFYKIQKFLRRS